MGADGHVQTVALSRVPAEYVDLLDPAKIEGRTGWRMRTGLYGGESFLFAYWDTEHHDGPREYPSLAYYLREAHALEEEIEVRTVSNGVRERWKEQVARYWGMVNQFGGVELARRCRAFSDWLLANADDWEVWT